MLGGKYTPGETWITPEGIATLKGDFGIRTDVELRNNQEAACMTSSVLGPEVAWVHVPFAAYDFIDNPVRGREPFVRLFRTFLDEKSYPILFHCSGGRDRTGTLAFLLNGLLGVGEDDLCRDWEASLFSDPGTSFSSDRIARLLRYLNGLPGRTLKERIESYARGCGISDAEIADFRAIMLK